ncbi:MAG: 2,3-dihydro-2,3-dihydroxybenzoate dehydrogenase [Streptosporangiales bacterium]|nr:2,3-dihydro-2,3-dihydroxybenzoate dehydrogenase [Streptosporangiales bacterium]
MDGFEDRVAVVTGAAAGIGEAVAHGLARNGATVAAVDLDAAGLDTLVEKLDRPGRHAAYPADVRDPASVDAAVDRVEAELGPVDVLVNVAGVLRTGQAVEMSDEDWAAVFAVNTFGVFHACRAVGRRMAARGYGCIVTVASNAAGVPRMGMSAYAASKAAAAHFTRCLALELAPRGIRCNVVAPGSTDTTMLRSMWHDGYGAQSTIDGAPEQYRVGIPLQKLARPDDVADAVLFLASDRAGHITMQDLYVDGGAALRA